MEDHWEQTEIVEVIVRIEPFQSFAHVSAVSGWRRPSFGADLVLQDAIHPVLGLVHKDSDLPLIPNNVFANDDRNFIIVTGMLIAFLVWRDVGF